MFRVFRIKNIRIVTIILLIICIIQLIPIINLCIYDIHEKNNSLTDYKKIIYRTGDLLFFKWQDTNIFNRNKMILNYSVKDRILEIPLCMTNTYYSHMGIVIVINNIPYIYETIDKSSYPLKNLFCNYQNKLIEKGYFGPVLHNISDIKYYLGDVHHISYRGPEIKKDKIFNTLKLCKDKKLDYKNAYFTNCFLKSKIKEKSLTCVGFITHVLNHFNIYDKLLNECSSSNNIYTFCMKSKLYHNLISKINLY
jgi:hypothetical protein